MDEWSIFSLDSSGSGWSLCRGCCARPIFQYRVSKHSFLHWHFLKLDQRPPSQDLSRQIGVEYFEIFTKSFVFMTIICLGLGWISIILQHCGLSENSQICLSCGVHTGKFDFMHTGTFDLIWFVAYYCIMNQGVPGGSNKQLCAKFEGPMIKTLGKFSFHKRCAESDMGMVW